MNKELLQERKKMIYDFICDELYVPMKAKEMAIVLNVPKSQRGELLEVLDALTADGKVEISGRGKYVKSEGKYLTGVFTAHPRGFGFVTVEGEEEDIFIPAAQTNGALHKDTVQITLSKNSSGKRKEGTVTKILSRGTEQLVCTYEKSKTFGFAVPDNPRFAQDIFIPLERSKGAVSGHKVVYSAMRGRLEATVCQSKPRQNPRFPAWYMTSPHPVPPFSLNRWRSIDITYIPIK